MSEVYICVCVCVCVVNGGGGVYSSAFIMLLHHLYISYTHCKYGTPCHIPYSQLCKGARAPSTSCASLGSQTYHSDFLLLCLVLLLCLIWFE